MAFSMVWLEIFAYSWKVAKQIENEKFEIRGVSSLRLLDCPTIELGAAAGSKNLVELALVGAPAGLTGVVESRGVGACLALIDDGRLVADGSEQRGHELAEVALGLVVHACLQLLAVDL